MGMAYSPEKVATLFFLAATALDMSFWLFVLVLCCAFQNSYFEDVLCRPRNCNEKKKKFRVKAQLFFTKYRSMTEKRSLFLFFVEQQSFRASPPDWVPVRDSSVSFVCTKRTDRHWWTTVLWKPLTVLGRYSGRFGIFIVSVPLSEKIG